jgi:DNA-binding response OmpR family regulator
MPSPKGRILCTEDDKDTRDLLIFLLQSEGYEVVCTDNAEHALSLAKSQRFDLFLVDSWLPDSSGANLTKWIREFDNKTPVLFYSGAAYNTDLQIALKAGANGYIVKPADNDKIVAEITRLIENSKLVYI